MGRVNQTRGKRLAGLTNYGLGVKGKSLGCFFEVGMGGAGGFTQNGPLTGRIKHIKGDAVKAKTVLDYGRDLLIESTGIQEGVDHPAYQQGLGSGGTMGC
jgi:hypothetical protein